MIDSLVRIAYYLYREFFVAQEIPAGLPCAAKAAEPVRREPAKCEVNKLARRARQRLA